MERFLEAMAAGLNGPDAEGKDLQGQPGADRPEGKLCAVDRERSTALQARRTGPDANATLALTKDIFVKMIAGTAGVRDTLMSDDLKVTGSKID